MAEVTEKEGISATAAADAVRDIGAKVKNVVTAAGAKIADDAGSATANAGEPQPDDDVVRVIRPASGLKSGVDW